MEISLLGSGEGPGASDPPGLLYTLPILHSLANFLANLAPKRPWQSGKTVSVRHRTALVKGSTPSPLIPSPALANTLQGWWKHVYGGTTDYYYVFKDGRARYTKRAPRAASESLNIPNGSAYWFEQLDKVAFVWRNTGTLETWKKSVKPNQFTTTMNDAITGVATKLFP